MHNWQTKKLGEIIVENSKSLLRSKGNLVGQFPFFVSGYKVKEIDQFLVNGENIFLPTGGNFYVHFFNGKSAYSTDTWSIKTTTNADIKYLYFFLVLNQDLINSKMFKGAAIRHLQKKDLKNIEITLPSLSEQKKIVKILDEKMGKIAEAKRLREEALVDTEKILSQTLHEIFEEGKKKGWEEKKVSDIADIKGGKRLSKGERLIDDKTSHPYLRVTDFKDEILDTARVKFINERTFEQIKRYTISSSDIFVSIAGTIGLVRRIPKEFDGASLTENASKITNIDKKILKDFLYWQLQTESIQRNFINKAIQTTISKLALYKIAEQKILIPLISEQQKIVKRLDDLSAKIRQAVELQKSQLEDLKKLEKAYLREAFNGELI